MALPRPSCPTLPASSGIAAGEAGDKVTRRRFFTAGLGPFLMAAELGAAVGDARSQSIQNALSGIESECRKGGNGDWHKYYHAAAPVQKELNDRVAEAFQHPRPSRVRPGNLALLRSRNEPLRFTTAGDCLHACRYDFQHPGQPLATEDWIRSMRMVAQITALSNWLKSRGTDLILVPVPRVVELYPSAFLATDIPPSGVIAPHLRYVTAELLRANVEVFDLFPRLKAVADNAEVPLYLATDSHWTDVAQRITAQLLAKHLIRYPFAQSARQAPALYKVRPAEFRFGGYFYEYLTAPELAQTRASMTQPIEEVITPSGQPFAASSKAPLMLVGDSFTSFALQAIGREQSGEAAALRKTNDPFAEFRLPPGSGIAAYLARELNVKVSHRSMLGATLEPFRDLFREPELLGGAQALVWIVNHYSLFRPDAYPPTFRTPAG